MLIAMAGLPGTGKSSLAEEVGRQLGVAVVSVDPIESAILSAGIDVDQPTGLAAYLVAEKLAESVLESGQSVIVDAVNAADAAREQWVGLAARRKTALKFIEVVCSDPEVQRARLEARSGGLSGAGGPESRQVERSLDEYAEWSGASEGAQRVTLDSVDPLAELVERAVAFIRD